MISNEPPFICDDHAWWSETEECQGCEVNDRIAFPGYYERQAGLRELREAAQVMWYAHTEDERFIGRPTTDPYGDFERALLAELAHPLTVAQVPAQESCARCGILYEQHRNIDHEFVVLPAQEKKHCAGCKWHMEEDECEGI